MVCKSLLSLGLYSSILVLLDSEPLVDSILIDSDLVRFRTVTDVLHHNRSVLHGFNMKSPS
jgi:hypothetical protein